jgi:hypothetical protein
MTDVSPDNSAASSSGVPNGKDPLSGLYKMSTTAGLGSADYVAINATSIVALLLGVASILCLIFGTGLLVVPVAAVICAVIAWRQISNSSGTQSGRILAIGGLALALVFGGMQLVRSAQAAARQRADEAELNAVISTFGDAIKAHNYDAAYALFSEAFSRQVPKADFVQKWKPLENHPTLGALKSVEGNGAFSFEFDSASDLRYAVTLLVLTFEKAQTPSRFDVVFRRQGDKWVIENIPTLFNQQPPAPGGPGGPGGGPPGAPSM